MTHPLGVALFGCGGYGRALARALAEVPRLRLVQAYDPDPERALAVGAERVAGSEAEALADPEVGAVMLATPNRLHRDQGLQVLAAGRHLFVEKPLATDFAAGMELLEAGLERQATLVVGHNLELLAPLAQLRERLAGCRVARACFTFSRALGDAGSEGDWRFDSASCPGGPLIQLGIHGVGILLDWFGPSGPVTARVEERDREGRVLAGALNWTAGGTALEVRSDYLGRHEFLRLVLETDRGVHILGTGYTEWPGGRQEWDLDQAFHASRAALLERFAGAVARGEPGNGVHALAALQVVEAVLTA